MLERHSCARPPDATSDDRDPRQAGHAATLIPADRPEPGRAVGVPGVWGYVERIGVPPGDSVRFHVSAPAAYELSVVRLGRTAILDDPTSDAADRADAE